MKKILLYIVAFTFMLAGCSSDSDGNVNTTPGDGTGGSLAIFVLKGDYLYTVDNMKLNVFSLLNTDEPVKVNDINVGFNIETLFSNGQYLFIGSRDGMYIYSVANPEIPQQLSAVQHVTACDPVVANETHSFVTLHSTSFCGNNVNSLEIYNTTNPQYPQLVHTRNLVEPKGLGLYNNYLFVCDDEIKIFDVQNPAEPVLAGAINKYCFDVIILNNDLFTIGQNGLSRYSLNPADITDINLESEVLF